MADGKQGAQLPFGSFAALAIFLAGALVSTDFGLLPTRPTPQHVKQDHYPQIQDVPARLWEDPFAATAPDARAQATQGEKRFDPGPDERRKALQTAIQAPNPECTRLMPVLVRGGPYGEHAEHRRRTRYAVVSALQRWKFSASDDEHIGFIELALPFVSTPAAPLRIPFEGYRRVPGRKVGAAKCTDGEHVFILWLDEDAFLERPIAKLNAFIEFLIGDKRGYPEVSLIGPVTSSALQNILREVSGDNENKRVWTHPFRLTMLSWGATRPNAEFRSEDGKKALLPLDFRKTNIVLHRPVVDDSKVADRLIAELGVRGVRLRSDRIAIISESDTDYGTRLAAIVGNRIRSVKGRAGAQPSEACTAILASRVLEFHYLRGLDGETALAASAAKSDEREVRKDAKKSASERPSAAGLSQLDYAERAATAIRVRHDALRACDAKIAAIGVLGTDFYDKSLLLQALKREMPAALFFTTDLDARMGDANQIKWTRNLVVGSGFGLELRRELQGPVAPFRDNYQTAAYLATLLALDRLSSPQGTPGEASSPNADKIDAWLGTALVARAFEIGRREIFDFGPAPGGSSPRACGEATLTDCLSAAPEPSAMWQLTRRTGFWALAIALSAVFLLVTTSSTIRRGLADVWRRWWSLPVIVSLVLVVAFGLYLAISQDGGDTEPFRWAQGISAWPTLGLRFVAIVLAGYFLFKLWEQGSAAIGPLIESYYPGSPPAWDDRLPKTIDGWREERRKTPRRNSSDIARQYCTLSSNWRRLLRVVLITSAYLVVSVGLISLYDPPNAPVRGAMTLTIHWVTLYVFIALYALLLFYAVDAVRLFSAFIDHLTVAHSDYPPGTFQRFARTLDVPQPVYDRYGRDWIDIQFIAERAEVVNRLVYYPFIVLAIAVIARSTIFDNWYTPPTLLIIFLIGAAYSAYCALGVRRSAESARRHAIEKMTRRLAFEKASASAAAAAAVAAAASAAAGDTAQAGNPEADRRAQPSNPQPGDIELAQWLISDVTNMRRGAFAPLPEQPFWRAVLIPLTGFGGTELLQYALLAVA